MITGFLKKFLKKEPQKLSFEIIEHYDNKCIKYQVYTLKKEKKFFTVTLKSTKNQTLRKYILLDPDTKFWKDQDGNFLYYWPVEKYRKPKTPFYVNPETLNKIYQIYLDSNGKYLSLYDSDPRRTMFFKTVQKYQEQIQTLLEDQDHPFFNNSSIPLDEHHFKCNISIFDLPALFQAFNKTQAKVRIAARPFSSKEFNGWSENDLKHFVSLFCNHKKDLDPFMEEYFSRKKESIKQYECEYLEIPELSLIQSEVYV